MTKQKNIKADLTKVPPQALELETAVLGAIMLERGALELALEIINTEAFYQEKHQNIFMAMKTLAKKSQPIDLLTVCEQLKTDGTMDQVGGPYEVTKITNAVVSAANIETHCRIIQEKYMLRELITIGSDLISGGFNDSTDVFEMINQHETKFTELTSSANRSGYTSIDDDIVKGISHIQELRKKPGHLTGVPSGYPDLDRITHGWQNTDLIILAARPAVGKTAFALNLGRNAARSGVAVGMFSLEMSTGQLTQRHISAESEVWLDNILTGRIDDEQMDTIMAASERIFKYSIYTDDTAALNSFELRSKARRMKRKHDIGLIIIDYLQLMSGTDSKGGNREQEISKISRDLKGLAKELNIPIIALSQLSRKTEERKGEAKIPQLADLRESGAIEQDADMVMFMYRPEYYDSDASLNGTAQKGETHIKIAKHRNGTLDTIKLNAQLHIQKFIEFVNEHDLPKEGNWKPVSEAVKQELPF